MKYKPPNFYRPRRGRGCSHWPPPGSAPVNTSKIQLGTQLITIPSNFPSVVTTQDRSPFCISNILNEILQHSELMDEFLVRNNSYIF